MRAKFLLVLLAALTFSLSARGQEDRVGRTAMHAIQPSGGASLDFRPSQPNTRGEIRLIPNGTGDTVGGELTLSATDWYNDGGNHEWLSFYYDRAAGHYAIQVNRFKGGKMHPWCIDTLGGQPSFCFTNAGKIQVAGGVSTAALPGIGAGIQHRRVAGCATDAAQGATCTTTLTWTAAFADTDYTVVCSGDGIASGTPVSGGTANKKTSTIEVRTVAATGATARYTSIDCIAMHD
jgi:hypothetical protein